MCRSSWNIKKQLMYWLSDPYSCLFKTLEFVSLKEHVKNKVGVKGFLLVVLWSWDSFFCCASRRVLVESYMLSLQWNLKCDHFLIRLWESVEFLFNLSLYHTYQFSILMKTCRGFRVSESNLVPNIQTSGFLEICRLFSLSH